MIDPYPRYGELLAQARAGAGQRRRQRRRQFSEATTCAICRCGTSSCGSTRSTSSADARVRGARGQGAALHRGGQGDAARGRTRDPAARSFPSTRRRRREGRSSCRPRPSTTRFCRCSATRDVYLRTHPHSRMPRQRFRHPEDAAEQLRARSACHQRLFGQPPRGLWPSEGSVSDAVVPLARDAGFRGWRPTS